MSRELIWRVGLVVYAPTRTKGSETNPAVFVFPVCEQMEIDDFNQMQN